MEMVWSGPVGIHIHTPSRHQTTSGLLENPENIQNRDAGGIQVYIFTQHKYYYYLVVPIIINISGLNTGYARRWKSEKKTRARNLKSNVWRRGHIIYTHTQWAIINSITIAMLISTMLMHPCCFSTILMHPCCFVVQQEPNSSIPRIVHKLEC